MTSEENHGEEKTSYQVRLLSELRGTVRSIDGRVEDILDELRDHFQRDDDYSGWSPYDDHENGYEVY